MFCGVSLFSTYPSMELTLSIFGKAHVCAAGKKQKSNCQRFLPLFPPHNLGADLDLASAGLPLGLRRERRGFGATRRKQYFSAGKRIRESSWTRPGSGHLNGSEDSDLPIFFGWFQVLDPHFGLVVLFAGLVGFPFKPEVKRKL